MSSPDFASPVFEVADEAEANELYQRNGWTDGLPIVAPTEAAVARFLAAAKLSAVDVIGVEHDLITRWTGRLGAARTDHG